MKVLSHEQENLIETNEEPLYELTIMNYEIEQMFCRMVRGWFSKVKWDYNDFVKSLLEDDIELMNEYMNIVAQEVFSTLDTANKPSRSQPERFYHGFVLGLLVELTGKYVITSNRESGFGRYNVVIEPKNKEQDAIIIEFKVFNPRKENTFPINDERITIEADDIILYQGNQITNYYDKNTWNLQYLERYRGVSRGIKRYSG